MMRNAISFDVIKPGQRSAPCNLKLTVSVSFFTLLPEAFTTFAFSITHNFFSEVLKGW